MKKKIGILTFHRAINYGGILQCYALYKTLYDIGFDVDIIDYRPAYIEKWRKAFKIKYDGVLPFLKSFVKGTVTFAGVRKSNQNFDALIEKMSRSSTVYKASDVGKLKYDYYVCGSDQIWNVRITNGIDPIYFGQFNRNGAKIFSYAASIGEQNINNGSIDEMLPILKTMDAISVREDDLCTKLKEKGLDATVTVDPTILANKRIFDEIIEEPPYSSYVMVYALKDEDNAVQFAQKIAEQLQAEIIVVRAIKGGNKYKAHNIRTIECVSPGAFIGYIKNSLCNVIISFHGTVFSTLYQKNFYSLEHNTQGRYEQYLKNVGLEDRLVKSTENIVFSNVDYSLFIDKIQKLRHNNISYIHYIFQINNYDQQK